MNSMNVLKKGKKVHMKETDHAPELDNDEYH